MIISAYFNSHLRAVLMLATVAFAQSMAQVLNMQDGLCTCGHGVPGASQKALATRRSVALLTHPSADP